MSEAMDRRFSCLTPGLDWTRLFMSLTAVAGTRCMSLLPDSPTLFYGPKDNKIEAQVNKNGLESLSERRLMLSPSVWG